MSKRNCGVCFNKRDFLSRIFKYFSCQKCRNLSAAGYHALQIREMNKETKE